MQRSSQHRQELGRLNAGLRPYLKANGFHARGSSFIKAHNGDLGIIHIQTSRFPGLAGALFATANLAVSFRHLREWLDYPDPHPENYLGAHWRRRIGNLMGQGNDQWWELSPTPTPEWRRLFPLHSGSTDDLQDAIVRVGVAAVEDHLDPPTAINAWTEGNYSHLGKGEAILYAAVLASRTPGLEDRLELLVTKLRSIRASEPDLQRQIDRLLAETP